jgi:hypothetical protein
MDIKSVSPVARAAGLPATQVRTDRQAEGDSTRASQNVQDSQAPSQVVFSPQNRFDAGAHVFVTEFRDIKTGDIERQIPDPRQLRAYQDAEKLKIEKANMASAQVLGVSSPSAQAGSSSSPSSSSPLTSSASSWRQDAPGARPDSVDGRQQAPRPESFRPTPSAGPAPGAKTVFYG